MSTRGHLLGEEPALVPPSQRLLANLRADAAAGLVVFLVALPLCLGIAQASGAPLLSGLIAGMVGGLVVGAFSLAPLSVSGPAAGLAVIVAGGIATLGFRAFLVAVLLAGVLQVLMGVLRLGAIAHYFPTSVIKGMLAAIGVLLILKQLPHAVGYDRVSEGDLALLEEGGENTFSTLFNSLGALTPAAVTVSAACLLLHWLWPLAQKRLTALKYVPAPLLMVVAGGLVTEFWPGTPLGPEHLVTLPRFSDLGSFTAAIVTPDFTQLSSGPVWTMAVTLAIVASLETLLSLEAVDRLDPLRRISPPSRELIAQGVGNISSALIGGLPVTSVIVRSSANVMAGARSRLSSGVHGGLLLLGVLFLGPLLNHVPLASLAVVLLVVGVKLTHPTLWRAMWRAGLSEFLPFAVTVVAVVLTDLLTGTLIGLALGVVFAIRAEQRNAIVVTTDPGRTLIRFTRDLTFLQKAQLKEVLRTIPDGTAVTVDRSVCDYVDDDIEELLLEFSEVAPSRRIDLQEDLPGSAVARRALLRPTH